MTSPYLYWGQFFLLYSGKEIPALVQGKVTLGEIWCCVISCWQSCLVVESVVLLGAIFYLSPEMAHIFLTKANVNAALKCSQLEESLYTAYSVDKCR